MTTKEFEQMLYEYPYNAKRITELTTEMQQLWCCRDAIAAQPVSCITGLTSSISNTISTVYKFEERISEITKKIEERIENTGEVSKWLDSLLPEERQIVEMRYFQQKKWYQISMQVHYNDNYCLDKVKSLISSFVK